MKRAPCRRPASSNRFSALEGAAVGDDYLAGDGEPQAGVGAELFAKRPFRIESVENRLQLAVRDAGPVILDGHDHPARSRSARQPYRPVRRAEADRVGQKIADNLDQPALDAADGEAKRPDDCPAEAARQYAAAPAAGWPPECPPACRAYAQVRRAPARCG